MEKFLFKKIEVWLFLIILIIFFICTILFGSLVRSYLLAGNRFGVIGEVAIFIAELPTKPAKIIKGFFISKYSSNEHRFKEIEKESFFYKKNERNDLGYVLISRYDDETNTNIIELLDLNMQEIIYKWYNNSHDSIDHPLMLSDGSLLSKDYSSGNLMQIDRCSNHKILNDNIFLHHSTEQDAYGNLWTGIRYYPISKAAQSLKLEELGVGFIDDGIAKLSLNGELLYHKSILDILIENNLESIIFSNPPSKDLIHLNDVQPVLEDGKFWKKNDLFLSIRHQSMIMLFRPSTGKILWYKKGPWTRQHDVDIIDETKISIFDNNVSNKLGISEFNRYIVYDFETNNVSFPFKESFKKFKIATPSAGLSDTINRKEIMIEETDFGRLIIVDKNSNLLWRYHNKNKKGESFLLQWSRYIEKGSKDETIEILRNEKCLK